MLAAGAGDSNEVRTFAKVLHPILGRPSSVMCWHQLLQTQPHNVVVVVGHQREQVEQYLAQEFPSVRTAVQVEQNGTGHAVRCALEGLAAQGVELGAEPVIVLAGDTPLISSDTLTDLVATHARTHAAVTVLSAELNDPFGYGRIVRDADGDVLAIVEQKDATSQQAQINEINSGMFAFNPDTLVSALARLTTDNSQGEEYLTDVLAIAREDGLSVSAHKANDPDEVHGINNRAQLAAATALLRNRINTAHMVSGVTIVDPATAWIEPGAVLAPDAVIERNSAVDALVPSVPVRLSAPTPTLLGTTVEAGARVVRSHCDGALIGSGANVGPFTFLRPGTILGARGKIGAFVEVKKSTIGEGAKFPTFRTSATRLSVRDRTSVRQRFCEL